MPWGSRPRACAEATTHPTELFSRHLSEPAPNLLFRAEARRACERLPSSLEIDLCYLDPPYGIGATLTARTRKGETRGRTPGRGARAYDDTRSVDELVRGIADSLAAIRERLSPRAAVFLHMDHRAVHEAKVACDAVFGRGAFLGEIVWVPGNGARGRGLSMTHQTILVYARRPSDRDRVRFATDSPLWREPFAPTSLAMHFTQRDDDGRLYRERTIAGRTYRYYADRGRRLGSVWTDVPAMNANTPLRAEGTGYPTQKPIKLLERIVVGASEEGAVVADFMCGSGTTLVAAARHGRRFVGGDASELAIRMTEERLRREGIAFRRIG